MNSIAAILDEIFNLGPGAESIVCQALEERKALHGMVTDVTNEIKIIDFLGVSVVLIARAKPYVDLAHTVESRNTNVKDVIAPLRTLQTHLVVIVKSL